jgi:hypothetical protein
MRLFPKAQFKDFPKEFKTLNALRTPVTIQDFLNAMPFNFEERGETYWSPVVVLKNKKAHCMEGAMLAAAALWLHGRPPIIMDLKTTNRDIDHVVALFKEGNRWGAISKTNHAVLRYRDAIYRDPREIAMSYFNEYFLNEDGKKTLRGYSEPFDLSRCGAAWLTAKEDLDDIAFALDRSPHVDILGKGRARRLRPAEPIEIEAGKIIEWKKGK